MNRVFKKLFATRMCCNHIYKVSKRKCQSYEYNPEKIGDIVENYQLRTMTIGINIPDTRNVINENALLRIYELLEKCDKDDNVDTAVIHGINGNFCKGISLPGEDLQFEYIKKFPKIKKPVIACISGYATEFGFLLAIMCDIRIAEINSVIGIGDKRDNLPFPEFLSQRLALDVGLSQALDLILSCRPISGAQACAMGFVVKSTDIGTALGQGVNLGKCLSKFPTQRLIADKNNLYSAMLKTS